MPTVGGWVVEQSFRCLMADLRFLHLSDQYIPTPHCSHDSLGNVRRGVCEHRPRASACWPVGALLLLPPLMLQAARDYVMPCVRPMQLPSHRPCISGTRNLVCVYQPPLHRLHTPVDISTTGKLVQRKHFPPRYFN